MFNSIAIGRSNFMPEESPINNRATIQQPTLNATPTSAATSSSNSSAIKAATPSSIKETFDNVAPSNKDTIKGEKDFIANQFKFNLSSIKADRSGYAIGGKK